MRLMLKFSIPVEKGNQTAKDGTLAKAIQALVDSVNAEASYFGVENGKRMGVVIFEETDQARLPLINEPFFAAVDASIDILPVLNAEDLMRALG